MLSGTVRPIEYEVVTVTHAESVGVDSVAMANRFVGINEVVLLRCVDDRGDKLTAVGDLEHFRALLESGEASDPNGVELTHRGFPVVVRGWLRAPVKLSDWASTQPNYQPSQLIAHGSR